jgi:hypothetical protein
MADRERRAAFQQLNLAGQALFAARRIGFASGKLPGVDDEADEDSEASRRE